MTQFTASPVLRRRALGAMTALVFASGMPAAVTAADVPSFPIVRFNVEGNTLLAREALDAAVNPFIGPRRDFSDVQRAVLALEAAYRQRGYSSVAVVLPEQVLERGEIRLVVTEARIKSVKIEGAQHFDAQNVRRSLPALQEGEVPRLGEISASLRIANENPFKKTALELQPGDKVGELNARLKITDQLPSQFGLTLDNSGTAQTGKSRLGLSYQNGNLFNRDHVLTAQYQTSPEQPRDVNVYALAYRVPLYAWGDALDFYATKSDVNAGSVAAGPFNLAITGRGTALGMKYTWKLGRRDDYDHELVLGIEDKRYKNGIATSGLDLGHQLGVRPLSLQYAGRIARAASDLAFNVSLARNLGGGSHGDQAAISAARQGARRHYQLVRGGLSFSQAISHDWQWRAVASAQWADTPLVAGEQFGVGGAASVRGFLEREIANDKGLQGALELYSPELCAAAFAGQQCRVVAFFDTAALYRNNPLPAEQVREHVASAGLGIRWSLGKSLALQADYANVLQGSAMRPAGDWRLHGRLGWFF